MTEQQYHEFKEKTEKYYLFEIQLEKLKNDRLHISDGIIGITCEYQNYIDCDKRNKGFCENLRNVLIQFYDGEIERLKKLQEEI